MGYYQDNVLPHILNKAMDTKVERATRERVCEGLRGQVVEIGFGSGLNAAYYPSEVTKVLAVEPSKVSMRLAEPRIAASSTEVELAGSTASTSTCRRSSSTPCCRRGRSARFPTSAPPSPRSSESSSLTVPSTSSSTDTPPTPALRAGRSASNP